MKLTHSLPVIALVAGCSTVTHVPEPSSPKQVAPIPLGGEVQKYQETCVKGVDVILEFPYGEGVMLELHKPDSCTDSLGRFLHEKRIIRKGFLIYSGKKYSGIRNIVLEVYVLLGDNGVQEVIVGGKQVSGKTKDLLLARINELDSIGSVERIQKK